MSTTVLDVNVTIGVFNSKGYTAQDVMTDRVKSGGSAWYSKNMMELALGYVWRAKYPCRRDRDLLGIADGDGNGDGLKVDVEEALGMLRDGVFFEDFNGDFDVEGVDLLLDDPRDLRGESLHLKLVANPNLVEGHDTECPDNFSLEGDGLEAGEGIFSCQEFVATLSIRSYENGMIGAPLDQVDSDLIREDVVASFDDAEMDGNLTKALDRINTKHTFQAQKDAVAVEKAISKASSSYSYGGCGGGGFFVWLLVAVAAAPIIVGFVYLCRRGGAGVAKKAHRRQEAKNNSSEAADSTTVDSDGSSNRGGEHSIKTAEEDEWDNESSEEKA